MFLGNNLVNHGMSSKYRKKKRDRQAGAGGKHGHSQPLLEQPVADSLLTTPCPICGHPVDRKRMHFHMVRFHGAALRTKPAT